MWLPFDLGKSSKRHEEERHRWRRKAQGDTSVQGEECSGQREWPVQRPHTGVCGARWEREGWPVWVQGCGGLMLTAKAGTVETHSVPGLRMYGFT